MNPARDPQSETPAQPGVWSALVKSAGERRTKRALFFASASLMIGFTVAGVPGLLVCGSFGGSLYLVVLILRMQRHLRPGTDDS